MFALQSCLHLLLWQAPICPGQRLTLGLQRDYSLEEAMSNPAGLEGAVSETNGRLVESLGVDGACLGPVSACVSQRDSTLGDVCPGHGP